MAVATAVIANSSNILNRTNSEKDITTTAWSGSSNARVMSIDAAHTCVNMTANRGVAPTLNSISARDLADYVGFEIG